MKIELKEITVRDLAEGFEEKPAEGGVVGYGGKLDIRPPYQREFIYKDKQRFAYYNFCRMHRSLRCTPAMAAGIVKSQWTIKDLLQAAIRF